MALRLDNELLLSTIMLIHTSDFNCRQLHRQELGPSGSTLAKLQDALRRSISALKGFQVCFVGIGRVNMLAIVDDVHFAGADNGGAGYSTYSMLQAAHMKVTAYRTRAHFWAWACRAESGCAFAGNLQRPDGSRLRSLHHWHSA